MCSSVCFVFISKGLLQVRDMDIGLKTYQEDQNSDTEPSDFEGEDEATTTEKRKYQRFPKYFDLKYELHPIFLCPFPGSHVCF